MTQANFSERSTVANYLANLAANVPGVGVLHRITDEILSEYVPSAGRVLVLGAGGGAELTYLAERHPLWTFDGVDPSGPMLTLARQTLGEHAARATLHEGYIDDAPIGPFDAATCLLTLHFLSTEDRAQTLRAIRCRLRPGAPLLVFHHSVPDGPVRMQWFQRSAAYASGPEGNATQIAERATSMAAKLAALTPEADEKLLVDAGFEDVGQFYAALSMRGWVAHAGAA